MKKLFALALLAGLAVPAIASAQPAEAPAGVMPQVPAEAPPGGAPAEAAEVAAAEAHESGDPTREFNWVGHPIPFGKDAYKNLDSEGGPLGDNALGPNKEPLPPGHEEEPMSVPFIFVLINFGLLLILLGKKAGPIATSMAQKRSDEIKSALDEADRLRTAAKKKLDEYDTKLRAAETEIDQMITTMRESAEEERKRIIAAAEAQAVALQRDAEDRIAAEIDRARHTLQQEVVAAAAGVAEKLLRDKTTATDHSNLVDVFVRDVAAPGRPS